MAEHRFLLPDELDIAVVAQIRGDLRRAIAHGGDLLIDCCELTFLDSSGVALLLEAHRELQTDGWGLALLNVNDQPREILEWLGLADLFGSAQEAPTEG